MLSRRCGRATAVFVSSRHRDFVAEVWKCESKSLDLFFLVQWPSIFFNAPPSMSSIHTYEYFSKIIVRCNVFFSSSTALKHMVFFCPLFFCFLRHVSSRLRRRRHKSISPPPWNTFLVYINEHTVNLRRFHSSLPPRLFPRKLPNLAARMLKLTERRWKGYNCMAAVHWISQF